MDDDPTQRSASPHRRGLRTPQTTLADFSMERETAEEVLRAGLQSALSGAPPTLTRMSVNPTYLFNVPAPLGPGEGTLWRSDLSGPVAAPSAASVRRPTPVWSTEDPLPSALVRSPTAAAQDRRSTWSTEELVNVHAARQTVAPQASSPPRGQYMRQLPQSARRQLNRSLYDDISAIAPSRVDLHASPTSTSALSAVSDLDDTPPEMAPLRGADPAVDEVAKLELALAKERALRFETEVRYVRAMQNSVAELASSGATTSTPWMPRRSVFASVAELISVEAEDRLLIWRLEAIALDEAVLLHLARSGSRLVASGLLCKESESASVLYR